MIVLPLTRLEYTLAFSRGVPHEPLSNRGASKASRMDILTLGDYL
jgi:hypothetical protein